jgi:hypothetical protein
MKPMNCHARVIWESKTKCTPIPPGAGAVGGGGKFPPTNHLVGGKRARVYSYMHNLRGGGCARRYSSRSKTLLIAVSRLSHHHMKKQRAWKSTCVVLLSLSNGQGESSRLTLRLIKGLHNKLAIK